MSSSGRGLVIVGCPAPGCHWHAAVSYWALGPSLAAHAVQQLLAFHSYDCPLWPTYLHRIEEETCTR